MNGYGYYFSLITGILPDPSAPYAPSVDYCLTNKRTHLSRGCRPHIVWVSTASDAATTAGLLGVPCRLKGDETGTREGSDAPDTASMGVGVTRLITVDGATGKRFLFFSPGGGSARRQVSGTSPIPSGGRIAAAVLGNRDGVASSNSGSSAEAATSLIAADNRGNLFHLSWSAAGGGDECQTVVDPSAATAAYRKRPRWEAGRREDALDLREAERVFGEPSAAWQRLISADSEVPSDVYGCGSEGEDAPALFRVSRGSSTGFVGLGFMGEAPAGSASMPRLICVREGFSDLRVVDVNRDGSGKDGGASVVRVYSTTHRPTALYIPSAWPFDGDTAGSGGGGGGDGGGSVVRCGPLANTVLVCEGSLATLFDIRCPSAVLTVSQLFQPATSDAEARYRSEAAAPALVPGRLTSTLGTVADVCATAHPFEVALAIDRTLCVYDFRKFTRLFSSANALKYSIATVAATAGGRAVVCAGVDAEVRIIPLHPRPSNDSDAVRDRAPTLAAGGGAKASAAARQRTAKAPPAAHEEVGTTFRSRLSTSVSCRSTWQGGWVTCCNEGGTAAVGISLDHEVFVAQ